MQHLVFVWVMLLNKSGFSLILPADLEDWSDPAGPSAEVVDVCLETEALERNRGWCWLCAPQPSLLCSPSAAALPVLWRLGEAAPGFNGCRESSHLGSVSSVLLEAGWLAGWIRWQCQISDINHQPPLLLLL